MFIKIKKKDWLNDLEKLNQRQIEPTEIEPTEIEYCLHKTCNQCHGTGKKQDGKMCMHMLVCTCKRCNPVY